MDDSDQQLLQDFAQNGSEEAFRELVRRHTDLVSSAAFRQVRDHGLAADVAQAVFIILARRAGSLGRSVSLAGWLVRTTRYAANNARRTEYRRQRREEETYQMRSLQSHQPADEDPEVTWESVAAELDAALSSLRAEDRDVLVHRFLQNKSLREVGALVGLGEEAVRKRIARGLDRLRRGLARRGIAVSCTALAGGMTTYGVQASPAGLAAQLASGGLAAKVALPPSTALLVQSTLQVMALNKLKWIAVAAAALLFGGATAVFVTHHVLADNARPGGRDPDLDTDTVQNPGVVDVRISGDPGARFSARSRVGGKVTEVRNGVMPYTIRVEGRPFELVVLRSDGPGPIHVEAVAGQGRLGGSEVTQMAGIDLHAYAYTGMSVSLIREDGEKPQLLLRPVDATIDDAAGPR